MIGRRQRSLDPRRASLNRLLQLSSGASAALVLALAFAAPPALASEGIASFTTTSSTPQAGGHPDLTTSFELESPGDPESAQNVIFNAPEGVFGNPNAITQCTSIWLCA